MTQLDHPVRHVIGAILRARREDANLTPAQAAALLRVPEDRITQIETGQCHVTGPDVRIICTLYRVPEEAKALLRMAETDRPDDDAVSGPRYDHTEGSTARFVTVMEQTSRVRWLSPVLVPPPLCTPDYARAVTHPAPALKWPEPRPDDVVVLDTRVLLRGSGTARLMADQIRHLLALRAAGAHIHVVPGLPPVGEIAELTLPGGTVIARSHALPAYQATGALSAHIDRALAESDPGQDLLGRALSQHTGRRSR
ncbi:Scr1 family TA system antitoxin-like transcriptional regulator [Streptomyces anulatus]